MHTVLLIETDDHTLRARGDELLLDGYEVVTAQSDKAARVRLAEGGVDAVVVGELESPAESSGLLRELRRGEITGADPGLPVLALRADSDHVAVRWYQAGADIALPSTVSPLHIKGALDALASRVGGDRQKRRVLRCGSLRVDADARIASVDDNQLHLTRIEFDLLQMLAAQPHRTFPKRELTREVWGYDPGAACIGRTVDSHAVRLRQKLRAAGGEGLVQTVRGVGYRLSH